MGDKLGSLQPVALWKHFEEICARPHPSKKEKLVAEYVIEQAKNLGLEYQTDKYGNIIVRKPAKPGFENKMPIVIQGHLDMVCEKNADVMHDFDKDPIKCYIDGDFVKAEGTTLGADNGIGVAAALAIMESQEIDHGDLEFLFTLDEETGLNGANALKPGFIKSKIMLNLDSEEDNTIFIGCAGGKNTMAKFEAKWEKLPKDSKVYELVIKGLQGGHSGLNINEERGNALKFIARILFHAIKKSDATLSKIKGGSKHNAIPREVFATVVVSKAKASKFSKLVKEFEKIYKNEYSTKEPNLEISLKEIKKYDGKVLKKKLSDAIITAMYLLPNGVIRYSPDIKGLVQTSTNLAVVDTAEKEISFVTSQRSSVESEKEEIANLVATIFEMNGAKVKFSDGYPGWQPNVNSPILKVVTNVYQNLFNHEPHITAIHAGLECGIILEKNPGLDIVSFGPNIYGAHSPDEKVQISSVQKFWTLLLETLKSAPEK
jgi:dipeptidase D